MKKISLKKLLKLNNINVIDIREKNEYDVFHLQNSINISFKNLLITPSTIINKIDSYYIICEEGYRSKVLTKHLNKLGYNVILVKKGLKYYNKYFK